MCACTTTLLPPLLLCLGSPSKFLSREFYTSPFVVPLVGEMVPTDAKVYITLEVHIHGEQLEFSQILRELSRWLWGVLLCSKPGCIRANHLKHFSNGTFKNTVRDKMYQVGAKTPENAIFLKILKFSFSEFRKIRFDNFSKSIYCKCIYYRRNGNVAVP